MIRLKPYQYYLITAILLLVYFGVRLFRIDVLPLFIDETLIIERSVETTQGNPLGFATQGKLLLPWIAALFQPTVGSWWILRVVTLVLIMPGTAAIFAMGKRIHSQQTGWFALILITFTPMLHFHDRLALADTLLSGMLILFTFILLWAFDVDRLHWKMAVLAAVIFILALLSKSSAILMLPLPLVAAVILPKNWTVTERIKGLAIVYGTLFVLWLPLQLVLMRRNINFWGRAAQGSTSGSVFDMERILSNIAFVWEGLSGYAHPIYWALIAVGIMLALIFKTRYSMYLLAMSIGYAFALILFGENPLYFRYWIPSLPVLLTLAAIGYNNGREESRPYNHKQGYRRDSIFAVRRFLPVTIISLLLLSSAPFIYRTYTNPLELALPHLDRQQYIEADSAGTAIPETADYLRDATMPIVGGFAQCYTLQLYLQREIICLNIAGDASVRLPRINSELAAIEAPFYLVLENRGYATSADIEGVSLNPVATFERPGGLIAIVVYEVSR
jgi:4-amino-4-deoxy-L-arabinose transferase-like glycosyltransferase